MGIGVLVLGESGSGKSTALRNFKQGEVCVLNVAGKPFPFRNKLDVVQNANYEQIARAIISGKYKAYVVDDSQYLLAFDLFAKAQDKGYGKFTDIAVNFKRLLTLVATHTPPDTIVYFLHHTEENEQGKVKAKTVGKMLDNQLTVEGLFSIVLLAKTEEGRHFFATQNDGMSTAKSPIDMFDREIDNDLKFVDEKIREYWSI